MKISLYVLLITVSIASSGCWFVKGVLNPKDCYRVEGGLRCSGSFGPPEQEPAVADEELIAAEATEEYQRGVSIYEDAQMSLRMDDSLSAMAQLVEATGLFARAGHWPARVQALLDLGWIQAARGLGLDAFGLALNVAREAEDYATTLAVIEEIGTVSAVYREWEFAERAFTVGREICAGLGDRDAVASYWQRSAAVMDSLSRHETARLYRHRAATESRTGTNNKCSP